MQHYIVIGLDACTFVSALASAVFWFMSAAVNIPYDGEPITASISDEPELHIQGAIANVWNVYQAMVKSCKLNKVAAILTGIAALFGAATSIVGIVC